MISLGSKQLLRTGAVRPISGRQATCLQYTDPLDLPLPPGSESSANQRAEWCGTPTSATCFPRAHCTPGVGQAVKQSVLLTQCTSVSFSIDLSLCLENTVVTGSVSWFPIPKSTSWCCLFTLPKAFFQAWSLQRVDQTLWSAPRTTQTWQDHQTSVRLFKGNKQFRCQVNNSFLCLWWHKSHPAASQTASVCGGSRVDQQLHKAGVFVVAYWHA